MIARLSPTKPLTNHSKTKDGLIRMLLQSSPLPHPPALATTDPPAYIGRLCGSERALSLIHLDHCYSKPWNWKPESSLCQPTKTLFVPRVARNSTGLEAADQADDYPDVLTEPLEPGEEKYKCRLLQYILP